MRVESILRRLLGSSSPIHSRRLVALLGCVHALVTGGSLTLTSLGRWLKTGTTQKHAIKRVDRLVANPRLRRELPWFCTRIARAVVGSTPRPVICIDWTSVGVNRWALVAAAPVAGRAIPLLFEVRPEARLGNRRVQHRFLERLAAILPAGCHPIIVADAGFSRPFYAKLVELGWGYVIRVRGTQRRFRYGRLTYKQVLARATSEAIELPDIEENAHSAFDHLDPSRFVLAPEPELPRRRRQRLDPHRRSARESWLLATNLWRHSRAEIVRLYSARMPIEEAFRDTKSHRLGWSFEDSQSRRVGRLEVLLLVGALATLAVVMIGLAAEKTRLQRHFQANSLRSRRVLSVFNLGRLVQRTPLADQLSLVWKQLLTLLQAALPPNLPSHPNGSILDSWRLPF